MFNGAETLEQATSPTHQLNGETDLETGKVSAAPAG